MIPEVLVLDRLEYVINSLIEIDKGVNLENLQKKLKNVSAFRIAKSRFQKKQLRGCFLKSSLLNFE